MIDTIEEREDEDLEEDESPLDFEALLARFLAKIEGIPPECREAMGHLYVYRNLQDQRKRLANRANQMSEGKRVFWCRVIGGTGLADMKAALSGAAEKLQQSEAAAALSLHQAMRKTSWYRHVAISACQGIGMSKDAGTLSAAKLLWAFGNASRFATFGRIVRYARLAPENGKAPGRAKGQRIHYNPAAWQALFDLSETWNRMPDCHWRLMWDAYKIKAAEMHPDWPKWKVHAWGRRKMLREFLRDLYEVWLAWEARTNGSPMFNLSPDPAVAS